MMQVSSISIVICVRCLKIVGQMQTYMYHYPVTDMSNHSPKHHIIYLPSMKNPAMHASNASHVSAAIYDSSAHHTSSKHQTQ
mmetsp:Transcript_7562/g.12529  ORF Transcript_7562/g.12529 Transcript_7562/m.12529 type:complete len:82 (-) Transcript_7562:432-677(-)